MAITKVRHFSAPYSKLLFAPLIPFHTFFHRKHIVGDQAVQGIVAFDIDLERFLETLLGSLNVVEVLEDHSSQVAHGRLELWRLIETSKIGGH